MVDRTKVKDGEIIWVQEFRPVKDDKLRVEWDAGPAVFKAPDGERIENFVFIGGYMIVETDRAIHLVSMGAKKIVRLD